LPNIDQLKIFLHPVQVCAKEGRLHSVGFSHGAEKVDESPSCTDADQDVLRVG
jgi:hypothetical protein